MEGHTAPSAEQSTCLACEKPENEISGTLKRCARCQKAKYCSKECQASHWKEHKAICVRPQAQTAPYPHLFNFFKEISPETPNPKTYQFLIDTFRLRCDDDYTHGQHNHGIYGNDDPLPVFRDFLAKAKKAGMLPRWWDEDKQKDCERMATCDAQFGIQFAVEKADIQKYYKDNGMPMTLRMVAENVYGGGYGMGQRPMPAGSECMC